MELSGGRVCMDSPSNTISRNVWTYSASSPQVRRYAVLGAGFAGVSVAWHLLQYCSRSFQVNVDLYDESGIGAGASGISGGLLHPYSPKGRLMWKGLEGWNAALELLTVAEMTSNRLSSDLRMDIGTEQLFLREPIAWRRGSIRPAILPKHSEDFLKYVKLSPNEQSKLAGLSCIDGSAARNLAPGLAISSGDLALYIAEGININPLPYLQALWTACVLHASDVMGSSKAILKRKYVDSLLSFSEYDAVIICLGANVNMLPELSGKVPITLCRGVVTHAELPPEKLDEYKMEGPSILAGTWIAVRGPGNIVLGATKDWNNSDTSPLVSSEVAAASCYELFTKVAAYYPPIRNWRVQEVYAGVRAMPKRTSNGKIPLAGCIDNIVKSGMDQSAFAASPHFWLMGGLGSRGLIYHGWLGKLIADAVINNSETCLPTELIQWKYGLQTGT